MKKLLLSILLLALAIPHALAGEKTITISRNDIDWENANTVYSITKGGVELVMSGGMNNPNFLLMKQHTTITVKSHNFNIKRIVFHCLDNFTNSNLDPFYWGPTTLHIQKNQTHNEYAGTLTYNYGGSSYDALWVSTKSSTPGNYPDGLPAGYELMFYNEGKPVRFASIDITIEQEVGDMYELVTSTSEINTTDNYMLVGRNSSTTTTGYALSVNPTGNTSSDNQTSTPVTLIDNGLRVKAVDDVQFINFKPSTHSTYKYNIKTGEQYLRSQTAYQSPGNYNNGFCLTKVANANDNTRVRVEINESGNTSVSNWEHYAEIVYQFSDSYKPSGANSYYHYAIRHNNNNQQFRNLYVQGNTQQVYLYKPSTPLIVTSEVKPESQQGEEPYGTISLRDGILVESGINYSQKMDTVQFLATPKNGYKIKSVTIQEVKRDNNTHAITEVVGNVDILSSNQSINGTLYTFVMPANGAHVIVEFEEVTYHDINIVVKPNTLCGNVFITEGYVVQQDQVKSYDGQEVVFNVTPNPINTADESEGYYELSYVTVTDNVTGEETTLTPDENGNYHFTMPDNEVTITAYFYDTTKSPLWLIGTANGGEWHPYGPRFNYNNDTDEYYIDVYFKGTGSYGDNTGDNWGEFRVTWMVNAVGDEDWSKIKNQGKQGHPYKLSVDPASGKVVCQNDGKYYLSDGATYGLNYEWGDTEYYGEWTNQENYKFTVDPGIYRIYVGTTASENKGGLGLNVLKVVKYPTTLSFDPAGGATAAEAVEVPQGQVVTLNGDLYSKIKAINPNESDANFYYKTVETIDGTTPETNTTNGSATGSASLDVVNDGETVTKLEGWNYLGWIVADNSGYYKVISTPLHWIEQNGDPGKTYTVADQLLGVYAQDGRLWAKDLGNISIAKTEKVEGDIDMMAGFATFMATQAPEGMRSNRSDWDQSNWVELNFGENTTSPSDAAGFVGKLIKAGTVKGTYADSRNYRIDLDQLPEKDGTEAYEPNYYCTVNFMCMNQTRVPSQTSTGKMYYFLNPKIQEYSLVTFAVWDAANHVFVVPSQDGADNADNLDGAFSVNWGLNAFGDQTEGLDNKASGSSGAQSYIFHAIVRVPEAASAAAGAPAYLTGKNVAPTADYVVFPLDLQDNDANIVTAVSDVRAAAQAKGVEYVNIAGQRSATPWQGVNIVVTHYDNGTTKAVKVIK